MESIVKEKNKFYIPLVFFVCGVFLRCLLGCYLKTPTIYWDELKYYGIARSLYQGMGISIRNMGTNFQKILYSVVLMPTFAIQDPKIRVYVITGINSILMNSCVFPLWKFCRKLGLTEKQSIVMQAFLVIWPDLLLTETFMSENLYWPLFFWYILLRFTDTKERPLILGICEGLLIYLGYLCKEVFAAVLPVIAICLLLEPKLCGRDRRECGKDWLRLLYTAITFGLLYLLAKLTIFSGMGRGYHQSGLDALFKKYGLVYYLYAVLYYFVSAILSVQLLPFALPLLRFKSMKVEHRRYFLFFVFFIVFVVFGIAYAISIREDVGFTIPRVHLRYFAPALFFLLPFLFICREPEEESRRKTECQAMLLIAIIVISVFRGVGEVVVEQGTLQWASGFYRLLDEVLAIRPWKAKIYQTLEAAIFLFAAYGVYIIASKHKKNTTKVFLTVLLIPLLLSNVIGHRISKDYYAKEENLWASTCKLNDGFKEKSGNILYLTKRFDEFRTSKVWDTCFDSVGRVYYLACSGYDFDRDYEENPSDIDDIVEIPSKSKVEDISFSGYIDKGYSAAASYIDYIVLPQDSLLDLADVESLKFLPELSNECYSVYRNKDPQYLDLSGTIVFPNSVPQIEYVNFMSRRIYQLLR